MSFIGVLDGVSAQNSVLKSPHDNVAFPPVVLQPRSCGFCGYSVSSGQAESSAVGLPAKPGKLTAVLLSKSF